MGDGVVILIKTDNYYYAMRKILNILVLAMMSLTAYATGYESDIIFIDGVEWELLGRPVYAERELWDALKAVLPKERTTRSSNWDGFTTYWSIQRGVLCMDSVRYELYDSDTKRIWTECMPSATLLQVFKKYAKKKRIVASWLTGDIRVARGKMIYYQHSFFERNYENERIISIKEGKVGEVKEYQNYVKEGFAFEDLQSRPRFDNNGKGSVDLREMFPIHLENYPELVGYNRIVFRINKARVDEQGRLVECEVRVLRPADNQRLAAEMEEALKAYSPWRVSYINGEYHAYGIQGYTFTYGLPLTPPEGKGK